MTSDATIHPVATRSLTGSALHPCLGVGEEGAAVRLAVQFRAQGLPGQAVTVNGDAGLSARAQDRGDVVGSVPVRLLGGPQVGVLGSEPGELDRLALGRAGDAQGSGVAGSGGEAGRLWRHPRDTAAAEFREMLDEAASDQPPQRFVVGPYRVWSVLPEARRLRVDPHTSTLPVPAGDHAHRQKLAAATIIGEPAPAGRYRVRFGFSPAKMTGAQALKFRCFTCRSWRVMPLIRCQRPRVIMRGRVSTDCWLARMSWPGISASRRNPEHPAGRFPRRWRSTTACAWQCGR